MRTGAYANGEGEREKNYPLRVLVNNAGRFIQDTLLGEAEALPNQMQTNVYSAYYLTRSLLPHFVHQKAGHIFNMCSVASIQAYAGGASYCISKYALLGLSEMLREELKSHGIRVTAIIPGATLTDSWQGVDESRLMSPEDIASMVLSSYKLSFRSVVEEIRLRPQQGDL